MRAIFRTPLIGLLAATAACSTSHLQFTKDNRLSFTGPEEQAVVHLPLTVSWDMRGFDATGLDGSSSQERGMFAVFVDRAPVAVGKNVSSVADGDPSCKRDLRCPNPQYLADQGVYLTTDTTITLTKLPQAAKGVGNEEHSVTVALLDGKGVRLQESAWYLPFQRKRSS